MTTKQFTVITGLLALIAALLIVQLIMQRPYVTNVRVVDSDIPLYSGDKCEGGYDGPDIKTIDDRFDFHDARIFARYERQKKLHNRD